MPTPVVPAGIENHRVEPGREPAVSPERHDAFHKAHADVLGHVLGVGPRAQPPVGKPESGLMVALQQQLEGRPVPVSGSRGQCLVRPGHVI